MNPKDLLFATNRSHAENFTEVLATIRGIEEARRAAALFRSHTEPSLRAELVPRLREMLAVRAKPGRGEDT